MQKINPIQVKERNSSHLESSKESFRQKLKFMYWSEKQLLKFLYRSAKASSTRYLKASFNGHLLATKQHISRLQKVFMLLNEKVVSKRCPEMDELISEAAVVFRSPNKRSLSRDLDLIDIAKKIELFEIDKYNQLINISNELGNFEVVLLLEEILMEEQEAAETFDAVMEDTLKDELFIAESLNPTTEIPEEIEELELLREY